MTEQQEGHGSGSVLEEIKGVMRVAEMIHRDLEPRQVTLRPNCRREVGKAGKKINSCTIGTKDTLKGEGEGSCVAIALKGLMPEDPTKIHAYQGLILERNICFVNQGPNAVRVSGIDFSSSEVRVTNAADNKRQKASETGVLELEKNGHVSFKDGKAQIEWQSGDKRVVLGLKAKPQKTRCPIIEISYSFSA